MVDGMEADLAQCVDKVGQRVRREGRRQDDEIRRTEIKRLVGGPRRVVNQPGVRTVAGDSLDQG